MSRPRTQLSALQRQTLVRAMRATAQGVWIRALTSGERVTLASLHTRGLLVRRVWKESRVAAARGDYSSPAHEYQVAPELAAAALAQGIWGK